MADGKPGRPQKPEPERLTDVLQFRVTASEYSAAYRAASAGRMKLSDYLRMIHRAGVSCKHNSHQ